MAGVVLRKAYEFAVGPAERFFAVEGLHVGEMLKLLFPVVALVLADTSGSDVDERDFR